jgi:hypothetical protein
VAAGGATQETVAGAAEPPGATVHHLRGTGTDNA